MAIPAYPTIDAVFAEWNKLHKDKYGTYVDLRSARPEEVQAQIERLTPELQVKQQEWLDKYGDTPEAKAIQQEPIPTWGGAYAAWGPLHIKQYNNIVDRPWGADKAAITQKKALDADYINALNAYNEKYGTNFKPNESVLGEKAQPSVFISPEDDGNFFTDTFLPIAGAALGGYFLGPVLAPTLGATGGAAAGAGIGSAGGQLIGTGEVDLKQTLLAAALAGGTQAALGGAEAAGAPTPDGGMVGTPGVSTVYPVAPPNIGVETLAPQAAAGGAAGISLLDGVDFSRIGETGLTPGAGEGFQAAAGAAPGIPSMGGAQGITVPVAGGTVAQSGFIPATQAAALGGGSEFGVTDALRLANQAQGLFGGQPQMGGLLGGRGGGQPMGVDYSGLLSLLQSRTATPNVAPLLAPAVNPYQPLLGATNLSLLG